MQTASATVRAALDLPKSQHVVAARCKRARLALEQERATLHGAREVISGLIISMEGLLISALGESATCLAMGAQLACMKQAPSVHERP